MSPGPVPSRRGTAPPPSRRSSVPLLPRSPLRRVASGVSLLGWGLGLGGAFFFDRAQPVAFGSARFWGAPPGRGMDRDSLQLALLLVAIAVALGMAAALLDLTAKRRDQRPFSFNIAVLLLSSLLGLVWCSVVST